MKTYNNLWDKFISEDNFRLAYKNATKGKKWQKGVKLFMQDEENNLKNIIQLVASSSFHTSKYTEMTIYEPKERIIYKLPFAPDRIVQHAVMNILKPILLNKFIENSYACIEGRGQHKASIKCSEFVRRNTYALKCDIRKFYPSINQNILSNMLHRFIADDKFMTVLDDIIFSYPGGYNCPIGNYCSQWFGNFYLTPLDNFIKHELKIKDYLRYCDDFILFSNDKKYLNECRIKINKFLKIYSLQFSKSDLFKTKQGVDFCGYRHFGKYVLLRKSTAKRMRRNIKRYNEQGVASIKGWLRWCCSYNLRKSLNML